jgi:hypothetical protein
VTATLRATWPILYRGQRLEAGATFIASDAEAADLLTCGRAEAGDDATAARTMARILPRGNWCTAGQALPPLPVVADWNDVDAARDEQRAGWVRDWGRHK